MGCAQPGEYLRSWPTQSNRTVAMTAELPGDDEKCVAEVAALVERFHLVRCQVALFGWKQGIGHWTLLEWVLAWNLLRRKSAPRLLSIQS